MLCYEDEEALEEAAQRSCGCSTKRSKARKLSLPMAGSLELDDL